MAKKQHGGSRAGAGRKIANPEGPTIPVAASIPQSLVERMDAIAAKEEWNRSRAVTEAIRLLLKKHERKSGVSIPSEKTDPSGSL